MKIEITSTQPITDCYITDVFNKKINFKLGEEFDEHVETHDICDISGQGGSCGV